MEVITSCDLEVEIKNIYYVPYTAFELKVKQLQKKKNDKNQTLWSLPSLTEE
jgi:hypothetical protein